MSKNQIEIPYTEIVERVASLGRTNANAIEKVRGVVQDIYTRDIPTKHDWTFLQANSSIVTTAEYKTGTVSATTGSNLITFSSDVTVTAGMVGRKVKLSGNEVVYQIDSFSTAQELRINPEFQGANNLTSVSYSLFQNTYPLAGDFDRFPKDGGVYKWTGGAKQILPEEPYQEYAQKFASNPAIPDKMRLVGIDTAGNQLIEFRPAPKDSRIYGYDYLRRLYPLVETTGGLIKGISSNAVAVVAQTNGTFLRATTSNSSKWERYFFRVDQMGKSQDSEWYPVINIVSNSDLTLRVGFANSAVTTANYAVSKAPEMPTMLHPAVVFGALASILADQNDEKAAVYFARYAQVLSDAKRIYVSRTYSQDIHGIQEDWQYRR